MIWFLSQPVSPFFLNAPFLLYSCARGAREATLLICFIQGKDTPGGNGLQFIINTNLLFEFIKYPPSFIEHSFLVKN